MSLVLYATNDLEGPSITTADYAATLSSSQPAMNGRDTVIVTMADGTELVTDVYLPSDGGHHPVILARTPYGRHQLEELATAATDEDIAFIAQDVRGCGESSGWFDPITQEPSDASDTLEWITARPWFDTEAGVGILGLSYLLAASIGVVNRPEIRAMANIAGIVDLEDAMAPLGPMNLHHVLPWTLLVSFDRIDLGVVDWDDAFDTVPLIDAATAAGYPNERWETLVESAGGDGGEHPSLSGYLLQAEVPTLHLSGWFDVTLPSAQKIYETMITHTDADHHRLIGPWSHNTIITEAPPMHGIDFGEDANPNMLRALMVWFSNRLHRTNRSSSVDQLSDGMPAAVYDTGGHHWVTHDRWPPTDSLRRTWYFESDCRLVDDRPDTTGTLRYAIVLSDPVPTTGGRLWEFPVAGLEPGPADRRHLHDRRDVLVCETDPLDEPLTVCGTVSLQIYLEYEHPITDVTATLVDVDRTDGARWVTDGVRRVAESTPVPIEVPMGTAQHRFDAGHRLAVELAGSDFPRWDRPEVSGQLPPPSNHRIGTGGSQPTRLEVSVDEPAGG